MGEIIVSNHPPKTFEFSRDDLWLDSTNGDIYYKDLKGNLRKLIRSNDNSNSINLKEFKSGGSGSFGNISASSNIIGHHITSSGNISASGTIIANNFQSDGQQQIAVADSFNITGSITASGDVSASGTGSFTGGIDCIGNAPATGAFGYISASGDISSSGTGSFAGGIDAMDATGSFGYISASGDISLSGIMLAAGVSSSGDIYGSNLYISASGQNVIQVGNTGATLSKWEWHRDAARKWVIYNDGRSSPSLITDGLHFKAGTAADSDATHLVMALTPTQGAKFYGPITGSKNISSSGEIIANTGSFNIIEGGVF